MNSAKLPPAILLMGPTASGKTDLAVQLVQSLPAEIISVDSALVYRGMDIGTAKPELAVLRVAPHRLVDICEPTEVYSAARFREDALREMAEITAAGRIPLLVGGTMLYYQALQHGIAELPEADPAVRRRIEKELAEQGGEVLHQRLAAVDPAAAARIHPNDPQRLLRALEVWEITGQPLSVLQREQQGAPMPYRAIKLVRAPADRQQLHERIARRFRQMLDQGFEAEVRRLMALPGFSPDLPSMRSVGYRQMIGYLNGEYGYDEMVDKGIAATRQLAKRQMTWLRKEADCHWLRDGTDDLLGKALNILNNTPD